MCCPQMRVREVGAACGVDAEGHGAVVVDERGFNGESVEACFHRNIPESL